MNHLVIYILGWICSSLWDKLENCVSELIDSKEKDAMFGVGWWTLPKLGELTDLTDTIFDLIAIIAMIQNILRALNNILAIQTIIIWLVQPDEDVSCNKSLGIRCACDLYLLDYKNPVSTRKHIEMFALPRIVKAYLYDMAKKSCEEHPQSNKRAICSFVIATFFNKFVILLYCFIRVIFGYDPDLKSRVLGELHYWVALAQYQSC